MSKTKDNNPTPSRDEIISTVLQFAASTLYFDGSKKAWKDGLVDIAIIDVKEPHAVKISLEGVTESYLEDVTHQFYVVINKVACYVSALARGGYLIEPDRQNPYFAQELDIRERVLDMALQYFTGKSPLSDHRLRYQLIAELSENKMTLSSVVVQEKIPDVLELVREKTELQAERQWAVQIGDYSCDIALFGIDDNGSPKLVMLDK